MIVTTTKALIHHASFSLSSSHARSSTPMAPTTIREFKFSSEKSSTMTGDPLCENPTTRLSNWGLPILVIPIGFAFSHSKFGNFSVQPPLGLANLLISQTRPLVDTWPVCTCYRHPFINYHFYPFPHFPAISSYFLDLPEWGRVCVPQLLDLLKTLIFSISRLISPARAKILIYSPTELFFSENSILFLFLYFRVIAF